MIHAKTAGPRQAVILAAGEGRRLRPVTRHRPKALVPFLGVPLLDYAAAHVVAAGVERVAVNAHYLGEQVGAHVEQSLARRYPSVVWHVAHEQTLLGTGGALDNLRGWLGTEPYWVLNADAVIDGGLDALAAGWRGSGADAAWLVTRDTTFPRLKTVRVEGGHVAGVLAQPDDEAAVFCGVHIATAGLLEHLPRGEASCVVRAGYLPWMRAGARVAAVEPSGLFWADTGTPERYVDAHQRALPRVEAFRAVGLFRS